MSLSTSMKGTLSNFLKDMENYYPCTHQIFWWFTLCFSQASVLFTSCFVCFSVLLLCLFRLVSHLSFISSFLIYDDIYFYRVLISTFINFFSVLFCFISYALLFIALLWSMVIVWVVDIRCLEWLCDIDCVPYRYQQVLLLPTSCG